MLPALLIAALVVSEVSAPAPSQPPPPPPKHVSTLAYVGAGATVLSLVASSVCGIGYTLAVQADESRVVDDELPWLIGFGVGAAGVVTGLVLMVVGAASGADEAPASAGDQSTPGPDSASVQP